MHILLQGANVWGCLKSIIVCFVYDVAEQEEDKVTDRRHADSSKQCFSKKAKFALQMLWSQSNAILCCIAGHGAAI